MGWLDTISTTGYKADSKDKGKPWLTIPGNQITMQGVKHPVMAIPDMGMPTMMTPGNDYHYPGATSVREIPVRQQGGKTKQLLPIYTNDPKDPRLQAYNDSLYNHNLGERYKHEIDRANYGNELTDGEIKTVNDIIKKTSTTGTSYKKGDTFIGADRLADIKKEFPYKRGNEQPESTYEYFVNEYPREAFNVQGALYKKPVQPIVYKRQQNIQQLPISQPNQLPIDTPQPSQMQPMYLDKPNYNDGVMDDYHRNSGMYQQGGMKFDTPTYLGSYQVGGKANKWLDKYK